MKTIALSGYAQSGKDTVAKILVEQHGFVKFAFADKMKEALVALDPIVDVDVNVHTPIRLSEFLKSMTLDEIKLKSTEVRRLLQRIGTEVGRNLFGEDFWVDLLMNSAAFDDSENCVISDCRFVNEADAVARSKYGRVWRIERTGVGPVNNHISEIGLDDYPFDVVILNNGTIEQLAEKVKEALNVTTK